MFLIASLRRRLDIEPNSKNKGARHEEILVKGNMFYRRDNAKALNSIPNALGSSKEASGTGMERKFRCRHELKEAG